MTAETWDLFDLADSDEQPEIWDDIKTVADVHIVTRLDVREQLNVRGVQVFHNM